MTDTNWSNKSSNHIKYAELVNNMDDIIDGKKLDKPKLSTIENHVIILPPDTKIEPIIEEYTIRSNYFVEYLHFDNNGRLDGFIHHANNMYVLNNEYDIGKGICKQLYSIYKSYDFIWCNQSYTSLASSLFKHMRGCLPESQYDSKTREILDDFYPRALQWCSTNPAPYDLTSLDISKCYPSMLIDNKQPIPVFNVHDIIEPFDPSEYYKTNGEFLKFGEYYINGFILQKYGIKIEAGFYSTELIRVLLKTFKMPVANVKYQILCRKMLKHDTFKNFMIAIVAASAPVSERSVKLRKTTRLTGSTRLGFIVPTFTAISL